MAYSEPYPHPASFEKEVKIDTSPVSDTGSWDSNGKAERARWTPLTRMLMSGEMSGEAPRGLNWREKLDRWFVDTVMTYEEVVLMWM
jgi:hypothetical protein